MQNTVNQARTAASKAADPFGAYLKDIRGMKKLSMAQERVLADRIRNGDRLAVKALVEANLKFVVKLGVELEKEDAEAGARQAKKDALAAQLRRNALPDVYPEPKAPKG